MRKRKLLYGVGLLDTEEFVVESVVVVGKDGSKRQKRIWTCPYYTKWANMLKRCYSKKAQKIQATYKGCIVCEDWLMFSNFKAWMEKQDWEGKELDKDILGNGKVYSPDTCVFVSSVVNTFMIERLSKKELPIGVSIHKPSGKFVAMCRNPFSTKSEHLGLFDCPNEAELVFLERKKQHAEILASQQTDNRVKEAILNRFSK